MRMPQTGSAGARLLLRAGKTTKLTACAARAEYISEALGRPGSPARSQPPPKVHNCHKMHPGAAPRSPAEAGKLRRQPPGRFTDPPLCCKAGVPNSSPPLLLPPLGARAIASVPLRHACPTPSRPCA